MFFDIPWPFQVCSRSAGCLDIKIYSQLKFSASRCLPFDQIFRLEFSEISSAELSSIFQNFRKEYNVRYEVHQIVENFLLRCSVPFDIPTRISAVCG